MNAVVVEHPVGEPSARLAAPLLLLAARVLGDVPPTETTEAAAAVRAFARAPTPARYLAATRALRTAQRRHKLSLLSRAGGERRIEQGLDILSRGADLAPELLEALRALPPDARNGRRLAIISDLLTAHRLILARASGGYLELLQSLGPMRRGAGRRRR
jgi:hypothetical protein